MISPHIDLAAVGSAIAAGLTATAVTSCVLMTRASSNPDVYDAPCPPGLVNKLFLRNVGEYFWGREAGETNLVHCRSALERGKKAMRLQLTLFNSAYELCHPEDVEYICLTNGLNFPKDKVVYDNIALLLGDHSLISMVDENQHNAQRRAVNPSFSATAVKRIGDSVINEHVAKLLRSIEEAIAKNVAAAGATKSANTARPSAEKDLGTDFDHMALDIIAEAAFKETDATISTKISDLFRHITHTLQQNPLVFFPGSEVYAAGTRHALKVGRSAILSMCDAIVKSRKAKLDLASHSAATGGSSGGDGSLIVTDRPLFVDYLLQAPELTSDMIASHTLTFLFAGHETSATVLNWACYALAAHPDIQDALLEEVSSVIALGAIPSHESVEGCKLLNGVVNETLRLYPPVLSMLRRTAQDDVLPSGLVLLAGDGVQIPMFSMHRNKNVWGDDADEFKPERWNDAARMAKVPVGAYQPFLLGRHNCVGKDFALMELKVTLAALVRRVEISVKEGEPRPRRKQFMTMRSENPIPFVVRLRDE